MPKPMTAFEEQYPKALRKIERLEAVVAAGTRLYRQCHNIKQVRPRWANENVCEAMRDYGTALAAHDKEDDGEAQAAALSEIDR